MTGIDFHVHAVDKAAYGCRLVRKAVGAGASVVVTGDRALLEAVDSALWQMSPTDFIAHCRDEAADGGMDISLPERYSRSPVVLTTDSGGTLPHHQVLINLGAQVPGGFERFERLIEVIDDGEEDLRAGRSRWRHYGQRGYRLRRHDLGKGEA